jgi:hypothetical protein
MWKEIIQPGKILDRLGKESGRFFNEPHATISERGMAMGSEDLPYRQYRVVKPIEMRVCIAGSAPHFGASGGATQYVSTLSAKQLVEEGYLEFIE